MQGSSESFTAARDLYGSFLRKARFDALFPSLDVKRGIDCKGERRYRPLSSSALATSLYLAVSRKSGVCCHDSELQ